MQITVDPHPLLAASAFVTRFPVGLGELPSPPASIERLRLGSSAPVHGSDEVRSTIRDLLRHGGYKPTGRGKPASEYLLRAAEAGTLNSINAAVDACNVISLHSGLPISVVDLALASAPFRLAIAAPESRYVFNASGQDIDIAGLLCLHDAAGPCANAVKDSQRTKTTPHTTQTLSVVWGSRQLGDQTARATAWYRELLEELGATTTDVALVPA